MGRPDFPRTLTEFQCRFASEEQCRRYLIACRWPEGYRCPRCRHAEAYELDGRALLQCRSCRHQVSVTAGTVLHRTRLPLQLWFAAAYLVTTHTPGFSAVQLQRQLGLARYETAWTMLQKLRRAMLRPERDRISGTVEVDESYVGGVEEGRRGGRQRDSNKAIVVAAVEVRGRGSGRIRLGVVEDLSAASLCRFVEAAVQPGSTVLTDGVAGLRAAAPDLRPSTVHGRRSQGRRAAVSSRPSHLLEPQDVAQGNASWRQLEASAPLRRRVRIPVQSPAHADGGVPIAAGPHRPARSDDLQDVVCC
jgi:transposase-like protein